MGVTTMKNMFKGAAVFKQNLNDWKLGAATTTAGMFDGAAAFNAPVNAWDVSKGADISKMFSSAAAFNQDLSAWDVGAIQGGGNKVDEAFYKTGMSDCNKKTIYDVLRRLRRGRNSSRRITRRSLTTPPEQVTSVPTGRIGMRPRLLVNRRRRRVVSVAWTRLPGERSRRVKAPWRRHNSPWRPFLV